MRAEHRHRGRRAWRAPSWVLAALLSLGFNPNSQAQEPDSVPALSSERSVQRASEAMRRGDPAAALRALSPPARLEPDALYLRGRALLALGRLSKALALFERDVKWPGPVHAQVERRTAELAARLGRCPVGVTEASDAQRLLWAGQCQLAQKQASAAIASLTAALAADPRGRKLDRPVVELWLAEAELSADQTAAARARLRGLFIHEPTHRVAARVSALREQLADGPLSYEEGLERARAAVVGRDFALAAEIYDALSVPEERGAAAGHLHAWGMALFRSRGRYDEAAKVLARSAALGGPKADHDAFHAARALSRADRDREAVSAFDRFVAKKGKGRWASQAAYLSAWLRLRHGFSGGRRNMHRFVDGPLGRSARGQVAEGLFELAMDDLRRKRWAAARKGFERYAETSASTMVRARGLYWAGRAAQAQRDRQSAAALYRRARAVEPLHYYAQLSSLRLSELGQPDKPLLAEPQIADEAAVNLPEAAAFFARLGLAADAARSLRDAEPRALTHPSSLAQVLPWAVAHRELGNHARASELVQPFVSRLLGRAALAQEGLALQLSFAAPHAAAVEQACAESAVPSDLLYAIMRKESAFDPSAHSYADAIGLMQLLPSTAERVVQQSAGGGPPGRPFDRGMLWNPEDNIRLGARYLGGLLARYPQHPALAIAAYNAGTAHVDRWLAAITRRGDEADFDRFVERIPIVQTRNYVRRVLTNWAYYVYLRGAGQQPVFSLRL